jgi:hypothetical protein
MESDNKTTNDQDQKLEDKKCAGGKWEKECDDWECLGGCKYEKPS